ncbi:MAG: hypothetical protein GF311_16960 [Candidatus Lokiarchaeota archaeon]|nr:hypothetical protein [Candidatus Lokiarchaeota archaeon]
MITKHALKFFQSYVTEMIDIGGENLPKSISSRLGAKLAKLYKERGITDIYKGLKISYEILKAIPSITDIDESTIEVKIQYPEKYCPIGGEKSPDKAEMIQEHICKPYTIGFLNELNPNLHYEGNVKQCILNNDKTYCKYYLYHRKKEVNE